MTHPLSKDFFYIEDEDGNVELEAVCETCQRTEIIDGWHADQATEDDVCHFCGN